MNDTKIDYINDLVKDYGHICGIKTYEIKPNQFRYRLRVRFNTIGSYISGEKALQILNKTKQKVQLEKLKNLEDAFEPDDFYNTLELNFPLD
jgi:hypothetical protein